MTAAQTASHGPVDRRIASAGGKRTHAKGAYTYPGQVDDRDCRKTATDPAAVVTRGAVDGRRVGSPSAFYTHRAKVHDR
jgi:hypothetical protein